MKGDRFEALVLEWLEKRVEISRKKRKDYARDADCLSNFKEMAALCRILDIDVRTPFGVATFMELHKLHRKWKIYREGGTAENESLADSIDDQQNYIDLGRAILVEESEEDED